MKEKSQTVAKLVGAELTEEFNAGSGTWWAIRKNGKTVMLTEYDELPCGVLLEVSCLETDQVVQMTGPNWALAAVVSRLLD